MRIKILNFFFFLKKYPDNPMEKYPIKDIYVKILILLNKFYDLSIKSAA